MTREAQRGISKFEFGVVVAIVGILAGLLLHRLTDMEMEAERLQVELTIRNIRAGLRLAIAERLMRGEPERQGELLERDPADFLGASPGDRWRFDSATRQLIYRPRLPEAFAGRAELRWRLVAEAGKHGAASSPSLEPMVPSGK